MSSFPSSPLFQLATVGLEGYVYDLVSKHLGAFIHLTREQLNVSAWEGEIVFESVRVRPDALLALSIPLRVVSGHVSRLRVVIPWHALRSESIQLRIEGLTLSVRAESDAAVAAVAAAARTAETKASGVTADRAGSGGESAAPSTASAGGGGAGGGGGMGMGYFERMSASLVANIAVHVRDCRVHCEVAQPDGAGFVACFATHQLRLLPTDDAWRPAFIVAPEVPDFADPKPLDFADPTPCVPAGPPPPPLPSRWPAL
eukprot:1254464-Prymnesium_polylepis.1